RYLPHVLHLCAGTGWSLGYVPMARPRSEGSERGGTLRDGRNVVAPPRRVYQELIQAMNVTITARERRMGVSANGRRGDTAKGPRKRVSDLCPILLNPGFWRLTPHSNSGNSVNSFLTSGEMASERASQRAFFGALTLVFAISVVVTIVWC